MGNTHAILLICHSSISLWCRFRHLIRCICSTPLAVCPSCWWERTPGRTDSSLKDTDSITEPNKDRHTDQNSITFKDGRGMFAGESHHTFQFFNASCWSVRSYERLNFSDSYWWWIIPLTRHRENGECQSSHSSAAWDSKRKWTPFNKRQQQIEKPQNFTSHWPSIIWWKHLQIRLNTVKLSKLLDLSFFNACFQFYCVWFICAPYTRKSNLCNLLSK